MIEPQRYLSIKNWTKFQPKLKNGKDCRDWIRVDTRLEDDPEFLKLSFFTRAVLQGLWRMRGATGRNIPDDVQHIRRYLAMSPQECSCLRASLELLKSYGWLIVCNQQSDIELSPPDQTRQDVTKQDIGGGDVVETFSSERIQHFHEWLSENCPSMSLPGHDNLIARCQKAKSGCTLSDIVRTVQYKLASSQGANNIAGVIIDEVPKILAKENGQAKPSENI